MSRPGIADYVRLARKSGFHRAWSFFRETQWFDLIHGTDTAHWRPKQSFSADLPNVGHGYHYEASYTSQIRRCLDLVAAHAPLAACDFYDLGCGKGKALLVAATAGLRSVTGVEYDPDLVAIAQANLVRTGGRAAVVEADASLYADYGPLSIIYLFNPFDAELLDRVIARIEATVADCIVIYTNPVHADRFDHWRLLARTDGRHSSLVSRIYRRRADGT